MGLTTIALLVGGQPVFAASSAGAPKTFRDQEITWQQCTGDSAPPADLHAESLALGQVVDGVVLVVSANATRRDAVHRVTSRLEDLHVPVLGLVLNDRTFPIPEALYRLV